MMRNLANPRFFSWCGFNFFGLVDLADLPHDGGILLVHSVAVYGGPRHDLEAWLAPGLREMADECSEPCFSAHEREAGRRLRYSFLAVPEWGSESSLKTFESVLKALHPPGENWNEPARTDGEVDDEVI